MLLLNLRQILADCNMSSNLNVQLKFELKTLYIFHKILEVSIDYLLTWSYLLVHS